MEISIRPSTLAWLTPDGGFLVPDTYLGNLTVDAVYILVRNKPSAY
jgi:hypothetical protein